LCCCGCSCCARGSSSREDANPSRFDSESELESDSLLLEPVLRILVFVLRLHGLLRVMGGAAVAAVVVVVEASPLARLHA
jgi:hypothetical protein